MNGFRVPADHTLERAALGDGQVCSRGAREPDEYAKPAPADASSPPERAGGNCVRVYVASSWRNDRQPGVIRVLRGRGHEVYDFRNPASGEHGFAWSQIDPDWQRWDPQLYRESLSHPIAERGFRLDMAGLEWAEVCLLVLPCGRSAHLELGWSVGAGKRTIVLLAPGEPELMYKMVDHICVNLPEVLAALELG